MDRMAVHELGQFTKVPLPAVLLIQLSGLDFLAAREQMDRDTLRPVAILVVIVIPDLDNIKICGFLVFVFDLDLSDLE